MNKEIKKHISNLRSIFKDAIDQDEKLWFGLKTIEKQAHQIAEDECNFGETQENNELKNDLKIMLSALLGEHNVPVFFNGDPRGYSLKIDCEWVQKNKAKIETDWGGYGLLAPEFQGDENE